MKTAEETLQEEYLKATEALASIRNPTVPRVYRDAAIKAMHAYAKAYAEADRKDCAEKADVVYRNGLYVPDKSSILDRPYPEMK